MISRRRVLSAALAAAACAFATPAPAQTYPVKPVRIIVPFAPGGVDVTARLIADRLTATLGQPFIVENRPGAGGSVGAKMVDGLRARRPHLDVQHARPGRRQPADQPQRRLRHAEEFCAGRDRVAEPAVAGDPPVGAGKTVKELVAYAKANPGKVHYPSPGFGTQPHLVGEMFKSMTGLDIVHVPYRGSAPAITDLLAGQMQIYFDNFANVLQHVESGKLRAHRGHRRRAQPAIA